MSAMTSRQERRVVGEARLLRSGEGRESVVERREAPEPGEFVRQPRPIDPPERLDQFDERNPGGVRGAEQILGVWSGPRRTARIEQRGDVAGVAAHYCGQRSHRKAAALQDGAKLVPERLVGRFHGSMFSSIRGDAVAQRGCFKREHDVI